MFFSVDWLVQAWSRQVGVVGQQSILFFGSAPVSVVKGKIAGNHGEIMVWYTQ